MPLNNYFNPTAIAPKQGYAPSGFMGGMQYDQDRQAYQQALFLQQLMGMTDLDRQEQELNEYKLDAPVRAAARPEKISGSGLNTLLNQGKASNPNYVPAVVGGEIGEGQFKAARGQVAKGTAQGSIDLENANNMMSVLRNKLEEIRILGTVSPMQAEAAYKELLHTMPSALRGRFPPNYAPEVVSRAMDAQMDTPELRQGRTLRRMQDTSSEVNNDRTNRTNIKVAEINAARAMAVAQARLQQFMSSNKQNFQQFLTQYAQKKANGTATPQDDQMAQMIEMMMYQSRAAAPGAIDPQAVEQQIFPGIAPRPTPPSAIPTAPPQPAAPNATDPLRLFTK